MTRDDDALARLSAAPRTTLTRLPTPLRRARNLERELAGPELWIKHDDLTDLGLGGNKVRKLEHELAPERLEGVTHLVTVGGPQSNHCRVTAAAAARMGLGCVLVVSGEADDPPRGNALLHRLFGARIRTVGSGAERDGEAERVAREIEGDGGRALVIPLGASTPLGALGYARAAVELAGQIAEAGRAERPLRLVLSSSSGGTLGGLAAGFALLDRGDVRVTGISADVTAEELGSTARALAEGALERLDAASRRVPDAFVRADDREVGEGYGVPTDASRSAIRLFARTEGVVLDPVYTSKAAAGLVRAVGEGRFGADDVVVFVHTGGHPALFA